MTAGTAFEPLVLADLRPRPISGLTHGQIAAAEAQRELTAMLYRYYRAVDRMRTGRTARYVHAR